VTGVAWLALTGLGIYALRASFLLAGDRVRLGPGARRALDHARAPLLGALLASVLTQRPDLAGLVDPMAAAVVAVAALAARKGGTAAAVLAGLVAIAALGALA
jgi:branched-subunit amino acid transport protein